MDYILTLLTNGRTEVFERTLAAFAELVTPKPAAVYVFDDGHQSDAELMVNETLGVECFYDSAPNPLGMCRAHAQCHYAAAHSGYDWAWHQEDDQLLLRPVNLNDLAALMDTQTHLAQVALVRAPWNREVPFGGYIPQSPGWYIRCRDDRFEWIETTRNWATSPALMRTSLLREFSWPEQAGCETAYGPTILDADPDARFALYGGGEAWYAHVGKERSQAAFGY